MHNLDAKDQKNEVLASEVKNIYPEIEEGCRPRSWVSTEQSSILVCTFRRMEILSNTNSVHCQGKERNEIAIKPEQQANLCVFNSMKK